MGRHYFLNLLVDMHPTSYIDIWIFAYGSFLAAKIDLIENNSWMLGDRTISMLVLVGPMYTRALERLVGWLCRHILDIGPV